MPGIGTRFGTRGLSIGPHRGRSTTTAEFPAPTPAASATLQGLRGISHLTLLSQRHAPTPMLCNQPSKSGHDPRITTPPPSSPPSTTPTHAPTTNANAHKANATTPPSSASPDAAATSSSPCSKPKPPTNRHNLTTCPRRLDNKTGTPPAAKCRPFTVHHSNNTRLDTSGQDRHK